MTRNEFQKLSTPQQNEVVEKNGRLIIHGQTGMKGYALYDFIVVTHPSGLTMTFTDIKPTGELFRAKGDEVIDVLQGFCDTSVEEQDYEEAANIKDWISQVKYDKIVKASLSRLLTNEERKEFHELHKEVKFPENHILVLPPKFVS